jgi:hypothetical protein
MSEKTDKTGSSRDPQREHQCAAAPSAAVTEAGFTPGPWEARRAVKPDNVGGYDYAIIAPGRAFIAEVFEVVAEGDVRPVEANARLIAAAPDLLAALRLCVQRIERPNLSPDANVVLERAHDALAKARGQPSSCEAPQVEREGSREENNS